MNRKLSILRRSLAVAGAAFVGLAAAVALASPASAHHSEIKGEAYCDTKTGEFVVDWTIRVYAPEEATHYKFVYVNAYRALSDTDIEYIQVPGISVTEGDVYPHKSNEPFKVQQRVGGEYKRVALAVRAKWNNGFEEKDVVWYKVYFQGDCEAEPPPEPEKPEPNATAASDCDAVIVTLTNGPDAKADAEFTVTSGDFSEEVTVEPGSEPKHVTVPVTEPGAVVKVTEANTGYSKEFTHKSPSGCGEPAGAIRATCDDITFALTNPKDGPENLELTFTPSVGEAVTRTVPAGTEMEPVTFPASEGLTITISSPGQEDEVIKYEDFAPDNCEEDEGEGGGGPPLPVTGPKAGLLAGGAGVLLLLGAGLFLFARRRRIRFSA